MKREMNLKPKKRMSSILKIILGSMLLIVALLLIGASILFRFDEWHELDPKLILECPRSLLVYDSEDNLLSVLGQEKRIPISIDELQKYTIDAFVSAEDARFYSHDGIDIYRIFGAAWADIKAGGYVQGASTISQQLIKLSHLSSEKTLDRKLEEAVLALQLEKSFDKSEIMEMYMNYIYFGGGFYGIEAASLGYFGVHASELSIAQSAQLAGILKSPTAYSPHIEPNASLERRNNILGLMKEYGYLTNDEYEDAVSESSTLSPALPSQKNDLIDYAVNEAVEITGISRDELLQSGYSIHTTMSSAVSNQCAEIMSDDTLFPSESAQAAMVVLTSNGGIEAMIGGRGVYEPSSLNRAVRAERQPGSLIKPILVYAPAIELFSYDAATILNDEPKSFGSYEPRNSDDKYYGNVTLRTAVTKSLNIPAVSVLEDIGIPTAVMYASRLGVDFSNEQLGLPLALGGFTHGVTPLEMAGAYCAFSNGGIYIKPTSVEKIVSPNGETVYSRAVSGERVLSENSSFILTSMLQSVAAEGTGKRLSETGLPLAAKTGTSIDSNGVRDAWCAAYTPEHTAVIWMGTDRASDGSLPSDAVGGNHPTIMLGKLFSCIYQNTECPDFIKPTGINEYVIDLSDEENGMIYNASPDTPDEYTRHEYFKEGSEPTVENPFWQSAAAPSELGWIMDETSKPIISFVADNPVLIYRILRSDSSGIDTVLCEFEGKTGYQSFRDEDVIPGEIYSYWVTAAHPAASKDGIPPESAASRKMRIVIPFKP